MESKNYWLLCGLFFSICLGLGYPILNRIDVQKLPSLTDARVYRAMVRGEKANWKHMNYRVLVPYLARPIYRATSGRVGSWDAAMLALLVVNSLFTTATAALIVGIGLQITRNSALALLASLLYLLNFAVSNLKLAGLVDAGEGFFLLALVWALLGRHWTLIPLIFIGGAFAKESFVVFAAVFALSWWLLSPRNERRREAALWIAGSVGAALLTLSFVHFAVDGTLQFLWQFGADLSATTTFLTRFGEFRYFKHLLFVTLLDINLVYIFGWLLPLSLFGLAPLPARWKWATAFTAASALLLASYYGAPPGTVGRALFSIAGPLLSLAAALVLMRTGGSSTANKSA